jgi:small subunit ribosomal protein S8
MPASKLKQQVLDLLRAEGYITNVSLVKGERFNDLKVTLKYNQNERVIRGLKRISKPGLRVYAQSQEIPKVLNGLGIAILSTSKGLMTDRQARRENVGGEILAYVW